MNGRVASSIWELILVKYQKIILFDYKIEQNV